METTHLFGLVGRNIAYSFSKKYFSHKFKKLLLKTHAYEVFDLPSIEQLPLLLAKENLKGFNVTIPYKEQILPYLNELSEEAQTIGAVNTVSVKNGHLKGYNTDAEGFEKTLLLHKKKHHQSALILGDGGAAKAVKYILNKHNIPYLTVSRRGEPTFDSLSTQDVAQNLLIIQCTPVGTFPHVEDCLVFPFEGLGENHLVIDLIYNPEYTAFLKKAAEKGAKTVNGYYMLEQQAEKAWEIWNY
ncbi:shikimate dehydrogenase family protein [Bergeyella sp. RCAD1439]|uniref:shikimate dehydrogenase family protein n=1 Tax=Bergeyella anatis TaxID=3113737 RepID=UPI002E175935|nr:shikimate dehydrogenase [Bergeyella sp. RCAD1439]